LNGEPFLEIPPMHWWISAATFKAFGESVATAKLPSALAAIAAVLCAFGMARAFGLSNLASFLCAMMLATAPEFWIIGRRCIMDMTMCAFAALAFMAFAYFAKEGQPLAKRTGWLVVFWAGLAGALLSKGMIGLGIPCSGIFVWLIFKREKSFAVWAGLFGAAALALVPAGAWLYELYHADGLHAVKTVVWTNNVGRFTGGHAEHVEPFSYYFAKFPSQFLPWTILLAGAIALLVMQKIEGATKSCAIYGLICLGVPFAILCVAAGKRSIYLLPLYPVAALLAACAADWGIKQLREDWRPRMRFAALGLFAVYAVALLIADVAIHPAASKYNSVTPAFARCAELIDSGRRMAICSNQERILGSSVFYLGRRFQVIADPDEMKEFLAADPKAFAIADDGSFNDLDGEVHEIARFKTGRDSFISLFDMSKP